MFTRDKAKAIASALIRRGTPVAFGDLTRLQPVSRAFGRQRGRSIDRYYIEKFLAKNKRLITGIGLEVGEIKYLSDFGERLISRHMLVPDTAFANGSSQGGQAIVADLTKPETVPANAVDCFICTQTLNFIYDVKSALISSRKLLKPGGVLLGTVAGISQISRYDEVRWGDYWRFMPSGIFRLLSEVFGDNVSIEVHGNALAAQALMQGLSIEDLPQQDLLDADDPDYPVIIGFVARA